MTRNQQQRAIDLLMCTGAGCDSCFCNYDGKCNYEAELAKLLDEVKTG